MSQISMGKIIVFDGYPEEPSTKKEEQKRRASRHSSYDITFEKNTVCVTATKDFLGNRNNKKKLMIALGLELQTNGLKVITAEEDAEVDIVMTAINEISTNSNVVVVGSDTDLITFLIAVAPENKNLYFRKEKGGAICSTANYNIAALIEQ